MVTLRSLSLAGALLSAVSALPQFAPTIDTLGALPTSERAPPATTTQSVQPAATAYDSSALAALWARVEASIPVEVAQITAVQAANHSFKVPDTPGLPPSLQDHAGDRKFPEGFLFGTASAAQQYEGAVKDDGRGPSHWDYLCHTSPSSCNNYTSDVADNGRYLYPTDILRMKAMGITAYSFSISWTRIIPFGKANTTINEAGLAYYDDVIDKLLAAGIEPVVTLFHWDTPLNLVFEYGGFLNKSIVDDYEFYAETCFKRFGKKVTRWFTFNEPRVYSSEYQGKPFDAYWARAGVNSTTAPYPVTYNILIAHGRAVQTYRNLVTSGAIKKGEIALKNDDSYPIPQNQDNPDDVEVAKRHFDFYVGIFSQPIYGNGNYPDTVLDTIPAEILPRLTASDRKLIQGSADFYAIDAYRTNGAKSVADLQACIDNITAPEWPVCQDNSNNGQYATLDGYALGPPADPFAPWLYNTAQYLRYQLKTLQKYFPSPSIYITEFGFAREFEYERVDKYAILYDTDRSAYIIDYLTEALAAVLDDGIPLKGVFAWSFIDNFEWGSGLEQKFGMQYVNYTNQERDYKLSFLTYRDFITKHCHNK